MREYPERLMVAKLMIDHGLGISEEGRVICGQIEIPIKRLGDALGLDRRTVKRAVGMIMEDDQLREIFLSLRPAGPSLKEASKHLGLTAIEISVDDPTAPGIISQVSSIIAEEGISIRQAIADDPEIHPEPKLTIVVEGSLPPTVIPKVRELRGVKRVVLI